MLISGLDLTMLKKYTILSFFLLIIFGVTSGIPKSGPTGLMVDFLRNPSMGNINNPFPSFSWIVNSSGKDSQKCYKILVSSSLKKLEAGEGDIWNSGVINSQNSANLKYGGLPLREDVSYFWNVRIRTEGSKLFLCSEIQEFKTGLFGKGSAVSVMPPIKQIIQPQKVIERNSIGNYFADFGKAAFGTLRVQVESQNADSVVVHLGEKLEAPGLVKRNPGGTIRYRFIGLKVEKGTRLYTLDIPPIPRHLKYPAIAMPAGVGEVTPFRYCEIETHSHTTICKSVEHIAVNYFGTILRAVLHALIQFSTRFGIYANTALKLPVFVAYMLMATGSELLTRVMHTSINLDITVPTGNIRWPVFQSNI